MLLNSAFIIVAREIGIAEAKALLETMTPDESLLKFIFWANCPGFNF